MLNNIYLICGKSGSGKTTIVDTLSEKLGYQALQSYTTRKPRHPNDTDHIYSNISGYMNAKEANQIIAQTVFDYHYYWATVEQLEKSDLYIIDKAGITSLKNNYHGNRKLIVIYIDVDTEICVQRMKLRGDSSNKIWERLKNDEKAFVDIEKMSDFIVDGHGKSNETWQSVANIILDCEKLSTY